MKNNHERFLWAFLASWVVLLAILAILIGTPQP
jgi:hypothetical protein